MTGGAPQQSALASRVERLVERAMAFAVDERDDALAVARLAWLARDDQAALDQAGEVCQERTEAGLVVRARAAGLLAQARHREHAAPTAGTARPGDLDAAARPGNLDAALAALYRLPSGQFVAGRDQLARRLRAAGDPATARRVAALRRPPVSAWAANQLAHVAPNALAELLEAGAALRQAHQDALAGRPGAARRLRSSSAQLRGAITRLTRRAETLLTRAGHAAGDATLARLAATLRAAATGDEATRAALAQGRLPRDLDPAGFGLDLAPAPAEPAGDRSTAGRGRRAPRGPGPAPSVRRRPARWRR